ncbi:MAG TPA: DHA2 family efflux MFS transporter permease subunit [Methanoregulaceae archaeon]|nr:DHA2 family efflux MFS transporter permease subunit [Methanoregulaceae archaeon]
MGFSSGNDDKKGFGLLLLSISLAIFMAALDGTIVNIALPTISSSFNISTTTVSWVSTAYLIALAGCVIIFGKISDLIGFKKIFLSGFAIFTIGSFMCGFLPDLFGSFDLLILSRVFQAVGGSMMTAIAPAMVTEYIPLQQRAKAMGLVITIAALGTAIGPTVGGLLTEYVSWTWIFFINVPVGIFAVILGLRFVPEDSRVGSLSGFDYRGGILIFVGLASLIFAITEGLTIGWTSLSIIASLLLAAVSLGYLVFHELRCNDPLLELRLFSNRNFLFANLSLALLFFSFGGVNYLLPFYLEYVQGYSSAFSGIILTALSLAMMISGIAAGLLYNRIGGRKLSIAAGVIILLGYFLLTWLKVDTTLSMIVATLFIIGFGLGLLVTPVTNMIMNSVAKSYQGMVSSLTTLERFAPMPLGIACFNLMLLWGMSVVGRHQHVTSAAPANIRIGVLTAGFDIAFAGAFIAGILILVLALVTRMEVHPDYLNSDDDEVPLAMV